jgi:acetylornithine deacetylase
VCIAHKGFVWARIETKGRAAHGSRFREGVDANMRMGRVLRELERLQRSFESSPGHPLLGPPSLHAGLIAGGTAESVYAARCRLTVERRTIPGESEAQVTGELVQIMEKLRAEDASFEAEVQTTLARPPFETRPDAPIARAVAAALGGKAEFVGDSPWMDSALLSAAGIETVVFGPVGAGAHSDDEWVDLESVYRTAQVLADTAVNYCGT